MRKVFKKAMSSKGEPERVVRIQRLYPASKACPLGPLIPLVVVFGDPDA